MLSLFTRPALRVLLLPSVPLKAIKAWLSCQAFRTKFYESVEALQEDLDQWLIYYNTERPHQGYRNQGGKTHGENRGICGKC